MVFPLHPLEIFACVLAPLLIIYLYVVKHNADGNKKSTRMPPEPEGALAVVGHLHLLGKEPQLHRKLAAMADECGPIFAIRLGSKRALVISSKDVVKECFTVNDNVFSTRPRPLPVKLLYDVFNYGYPPFSPHWRDIRKMAVTQLFSIRRLELLERIRHMEVNYLIEGLCEICREKGGPASVELKERFGNLAINIILRSVAGKRYEGADPESARCLRAFHEFSRLVGMNYYSDAFPALGWMDILNGSVRELKSVAAEIDYFLSSWLTEHRRKRLAGEIEERDRDFIDVMLSALEDGRPPEEIDRVIKATCLGLVGGGNDTTVITLTWALSLLLNHQNALKKARDELDIHVGYHRQVDESDTGNLPYLQAVIKETLRLYPAAPLSVPRIAMKDCTVAGFDVPRGTQLLVNLWKLHHDPNIWKNPSEFIPERFLKEHSEFNVRGENFGYLPFGSGRRMCPGSSFGFRVLHLALARLLHAFDFATESGKKVDMTEGPGLTLPKDTPLEVVVAPRLPARFYVAKSMTAI